MHASNGFVLDDNQGFLALWTMLTDERRSLREQCCQRLWRMFVQDELSLGVEIVEL